MWLLFCLSAPAALAGVRCGMAEGYPPFQFVEQGQPTGFDVAVLQLVAQKAGLALQLEAGRWDDIVARGRLGQYDCVAGMEITPAAARNNSSTGRPAERASASSSRRACMLRAAISLSIRALSFASSGRLITARFKACVIVFVQNWVEQCYTMGGPRRRPVGPNPLQMMAPQRTASAAATPKPARRRDTT